MLTSEFSSSSRKWIIVAFISFVTCEEAKKEDGLSLRLNSTYRKSEILEVYGDFFRTPDEQKKYAKKFFRDPSNTVIARGKKDINVHYTVCRKPGLIADFHPQRSGSRPIARAPRSSRAYIENYRYHGCCISRRKFVTPDSATSGHNGHIWNLVHFDTNRQYFLSEDCWHSIDCPLNCGCRLQMGLFQALVHSNSNHPSYVVRKIRIPGCCKCMNNLPPP